MRKYSRNDEERIRLQAAVREWRRSGFLEAEQSTRLENELRVDLRRTNLFFRLVLFVFTAVIVSASLALVATVFDIDDNRAGAILLSAGALVCLGMAEFLIRRFRLYRYGVEEALATASVVLLSIAAAMIAEFTRAIPTAEFSTTAALAVASLGALAIYLRFGYLYAGIAAMICAAGIFFTYRLQYETTRLALAAMSLVIFLVVRPRRLRFGDEFPGDDYAVFQAIAWAGLYFAINLQIGYGTVEGVYYWPSYALTWILPMVGLAIALRHKDRMLLDVNIAMALVTLVTNKPYLGLQRQPWDPILFGIGLAAAAIAIRRWLLKGPQGQRYGFTPARLLASDRRVLDMVGTATAALHTHVPAAEPVPSKPDLGGGRSGGGGASGNF